MSIGNSREDLSQAILVGIILVGRLGVFVYVHTACPYSKHYANGAPAGSPPHRCVGVVTVPSERVWLSLHCHVSLNADADYG